jgi:hypothetical protein
LINFSIPGIKDPLQSDFIAQVVHSAIVSWPHVEIAYPHTWQKLSIEMLENSPGPFDTIPGHGKLFHKRAAA